MFAGGACVVCGLDFECAVVVQVGVRRLGFEYAGVVQVVGLVSVSC